VCKASKVPVRLALSLKRKLGSVGLKVVLGEILSGRIGLA